MNVFFVSYRRDKRNICFYKYTVPSTVDRKRIQFILNKIIRILNARQARTTDDLPLNVKVRSVITCAVAL